jgi:uncharacterized protein
MALIETLLMLSVLAGVVVVANLSEQRVFLRPVLFFALLTLNLLFVASFVAVLTRDTTLADGDKTAVAVITLVFGGAATAALFEPARRRLALLFPRPPISGAGFKPESMVHMTALVFCVYLLGSTILQYALAGGMTGLAEEFSDPSAGSEWATMAMFVIFSVLGVGLGIRRDLFGALRRLGLRAPTLSELGMASSIAFLLFVAQFMIGNVWVALTPEEVFNEQTQLSQLVSNSITTLSAGFLLAAMAALGEEIAFRGALQPIFGLWPTAIFFSLIHIQYTLTPATLIIVLVGVGFGWLRQRYNTTVAIVAHFLYNFGLIAMLLYIRVLFPQVMGGL